MANHGKRGRSNRAAYAVSSNSDLLYEILLHLPPESLLTFKRVSRQWYDLISSRQFRLEHTRRYRNPRPTGLLYIDAGFEAMQYINVRFDKKYQYLKRRSKSVCNKFPNTSELRVNPCNGLLLFLLRGSSIQWIAGSWEICNYPRVKIYVCNPTTKQVTRIPTPSIQKGFRIESVVLAFDNSEPEKYRVVCVSGLWESSGDQPRLHCVDFYETGSVEWRKYSTTFVPWLGHIPDKGVFWNDAIYWIGWLGGCLSSFDLKQGSYKETRSSSVINNDKIIHLEACQGHLYMLSGDFESDNHHHVSLTVYQIEQDHDHSHDFSKKFSISHRALNRLKTWTYDVLGIFLGDDDDDDELFVIMRCRSEIIMFNNKEDLYSFPCPTYMFTVLAGCSFPFSESLAPV